MTDASQGWPEAITYSYRRAFFFTEPIIKNLRYLVPVKASHGLEAVVVTKLAEC